MIEKERPRIAPFLAVAFAVAALMYGLNHVLQNQAIDTITEPQVSKNDIRRALAIPLQELFALTEEQASYMTEFASLNANMIVIEFPIVVRKGNFVYLEWNQLDILRMNNVIEQIHRSGMEAVVSARLIDHESIMNDSEVGLDAYSQYVDWLLAASASLPDALFIHPEEFHYKVPASSIIRTFESLYESYPGKVFVFMEQGDLSSSLSHRKLVAGYIADSEYLGLNISMVEELEDPDDVKLMVRISSTETPAATLFEPYLQIDKFAPGLIPVNEMRASIDIIMDSEMFAGVIVPAGNWNENTAKQKYRDEIRTWFGELKALSRKRAFSQHSQPGVLQ